MMTDADLNLCLGVLRGYYPGEWDDGRNIVWTDALDGLTRDEALAAIKHMGRTEDFAKVSTFLGIVGAQRRERLSEERGRFSLGTGWIPLAGTVNDPDEAPADPEAVKRLIAAMRGVTKNVDDL